MLNTAHFASHRSSRLGYLSLPRTQEPRLLFECFGAERKGNRKLPRAPRRNPIARATPRQLRPVAGSVEGGVWVK